MTELEGLRKKVELQQVNQQIEDVQMDLWLLKDQIKRDPDPYYMEQNFAVELKVYTERLTDLRKERSILKREVKKGVTFIR